MADSETADLSGALELTNRINTKANDILDPLVREMASMNWRPEFKEILWNTIARKAVARAHEARTVRPRGRTS